MGQKNSLVLPDTNIIIPALAGIKPFAKHLQSWIESKQLLLSCIVVAEFLSGATTKEAKTFSLLTDNFPTLPIDLETAQLAAKIRKNQLKRKQKLHLPDCLIAAQCRLAGATLATLNRSDYPKNLKFFSL